MTLLFMAITLSITILLPIIATSIFQKNSSEKEKNTPFECGFEPIKNARKGFSLKFFLLAVLFLIFDVEIALMFPAPLTLNNQMITEKMTTLSTFLMILMLGLMLEWKNGMLSWTK